MLEQRIKDDLIAGHLLGNSSLTPAQLDTYLIENVMRGKPLKEKIIMREKAVSKGAYLRTLKQARENFSKAAYTLILAEYFGILEEGSMMKLMEVSGLLRKAKGILKGEKALIMIRTIAAVLRSLTGKEHFNIVKEKG